MQNAGKKDKNDRLIEPQEKKQELDERDRIKEKLPRGTLAKFPQNLYRNVHSIGILKD